MRHYSSVLVSIPEGPDDSPYAVQSIDCDVCGTEEVQIHIAHVGTVLRVLSHLLDDLYETDGAAEPMTPLLPATPTNKAAILAYLDREFPGWKADRIRRKP